MLKSILVRRHFRCFRQGDYLAFKRGVNLLVGDQGSGKSTLIALIRHQALDPSSPKTKDADYGRMTNGEARAIIMAETDGPCPMGGRDFEMENQRTINHIDTFDTDGQIWGMKVSHGQWAKRYLDALKDIKGPAMLVLDEPDMALSPRSIYALIDSFASLAKKGVQIIASAHNPLLILAQEEVFSLEQGDWISSQAYMDAQDLPAKPPRTKTMIAQPLWDDEPKEAL